MGCRGGTERCQMRNIRITMDAMATSLRSLALVVVGLLLGVVVCFADEPMRYVYHPPESALDKRYEYHWEILHTALERTREEDGPYVMEQSVFMPEKRQAAEL